MNSLDRIREEAKAEARKEIESMIESLAPEHRAQARADIARPDLPAVKQSIRINYTARPSKGGFIMPDLQESFESYQILEDGIPIETHPRKQDADLRLAELQEEFGKSITFTVRKHKKGE